MIETIRQFLQTSRMQGFLVIALIFFLNVLFIQFLHNKYPNSKVKWTIGIGGSSKNKSNKKDSDHHDRSSGGSSRGSGAGKR